MTGERFGPYLLEGQLGCGGMGEVYRAYDERLDRRVAIKHIRADFAGQPEMRQRLRREARSAARLSHPAVVQIYDIVETEAGDGIIMELVDGDNLSVILARGAMDQQLVLDLAEQIASALEAAHKEGIVHRDLKAENVIVTPANRAKVLDFGLAKFYDTARSDPTLTRHGAVVGTLRAMSPEQASGRPVDPRSDLFSLGVLLYEMATGDSPFSGDGAAETIARICGQRQEPAQAVRASVPDELSDLIDRLLEKKPENRPASAAGVVAKLRALSGRAESVVPAPDPMDTEVPTLLFEKPMAADTHSVSERRRITVLRCELAAMATMVVDPEELLEELPAFRHIVAEIVSDYDGHLWQMPGQSLVVYFGYPAAREDDARRAVLAALEIVSRCAEADVCGGFEPRVGVHTGLLVVSQSDDAQQAPTTLGDAPEVAVAVQNVAGPAQILISASTHLLVEQFFTCEEVDSSGRLGADLKVYQVRGELEIDDRLGLARAAETKPLVARGSELKLLMERWEVAAAGRGQVVLLGAEPGVGKTRLVNELLRQLSPQKPEVLGCYGSLYLKGSALHPIKKMMGRLLAQSVAETKKLPLASLEKKLQSYGLPLAEMVPLLADLLGVDLEGRYAPPTVEPRVQRRRTLEAVLTLLLEMAQEEPLLLVFEDLHWVDPSSLEFLGMLIDQAAVTRLLAVLTFRPEFVPPWGQRSYVTPLSLSPLTERQVRDLIADITGGKTLPTTVVQGIVGRSDGVPLFVEELTKFLLESSVLKETGDGYELASPSRTVHVPATLHDSLMARLDRLGAAKGVAQRASALGRDFPSALLSAVVPWGEEVLEPALDRLVDAELLHKQGFGRSARYYFKHALIRDAAYESLLRSERRKLHHQIAEALVDRFAEPAQRHPEVVAHHWTEAGRFNEATHYWYLAGLIALNRSALVEATDHLERGIELVAKLPESEERNRRELALHTALGGALSNAKGFAAPEVDHAYRRALELCGEIGEAPELFDVYWGLRRFHLVRAHLDKARDLGGRLVRLAEAEGEPSRLVSAYFSVGATLFCYGEFEEAHGVLEKGIAADSLDRTEHYASQVSEDAGVAALCWDAWTLWFLGHPEQALERIAEAKTLAERIAHPLSLIYASLFATYLSFFLHDTAGTLDNATELHSLCRQHGSWWDALAEMFLGWAAAMEGGEIDARVAADLDNGSGKTSLQRIESGIGGYRSSGARILEPQMWSLLAEAAIQHQEIELATTSLDRAMKAIEDSGERVYEAEVLRLRGLLTLTSAAGAESPETVAEADRSFRRSLALAREQGARALELRTANATARLLMRGGKSQEARCLVEPLYDSFPAGLDTPDLVEASALLGELD